MAAPAGPLPATDALEGKKKGHLEVYETIDMNDNRDDACGGIQYYYEQKIDELQRVIHEKTQDKRRLEAQRNELNARGISLFSLPPLLSSFPPISGVYTPEKGYVEGRRRPRC